MRIKSIVPAMAFVFAVAALAGNGIPASASDHRDGRHRSSCRSAIVGTYLLTIRRSNSEIRSRAVLSFHNDGSFTSIDSNQALGVQGAGFTAQLGTYECTGRRSANALGINFGFTDPPDMARSDWAITIDPWTRTIEGTVTLFIFDDAETDDPLVVVDEQDPEFIETFTFDSVRVPARVD